LDPTNSYSYSYKEDLSEDEKVLEDYKIVQNARIIVRSAWTCFTDFNNVNLLISVTKDKSNSNPEVGLVIFDFQINIFM
jgi:hypothetical protein